MDRTPGPKGDNFPEDCLLEDCLITLTGRDEKQTAPVQISMSHKIRVNHCSIYDVPRAGININEGTFGGHIIENCGVFNTVLETGDHGSFNSCGRGRYRTPDVNETVAAVRKEPDLPFMDMMDPNIIRNNRWHCDHVWDIDLDDGSTQYQITNNLLLNGGKELDYNYYVSDKEYMTRFTKNGCEVNSDYGDPKFIAPAIPVIKIISANIPASKTIFTWMDIVLKEPGSAEMSAFGVSFDSGEVALGSVPETSEASR